MEAGLKAPKVRSWHEKTLGELVTQIAAEQGLQPQFSPDLAAKKLIHVDQQGESDLHLLRRMALDYDAMAKPAQGKLLFLHRAGKRAAEGEDVPKMTLEATVLTRWEARSTSRTKYGGVVAYYYDVELAQRIPVNVLAPGADPQAPKFALRHNYRDATAAFDAAEAKLATLQRGVGTLNLTLAGLPQARTDMLLELTGLRDQIDGTWYWYIRRRAQNGPGRLYHRHRGRGAQVTPTPDSPATWSTAPGRCSSAQESCAPSMAAVSSSSLTGRSMPSS